MNALWKKLKEIIAAVTVLKDDETGLFIPNRQLSWVISIVLLFGFLSFITGYFWGQRKAIERFVNKIEEESFADRISYALYTMNDREASEFEDDDNSAGTESNLDSNVDGAEVSESTEEEQNTSQPSFAEQTEDLSVTPLVKNDALPVDSLSVNSDQIITSNKEDAKNIFVAPLAGFGTLHAARAFAKKVSGYYSGVQVKTRQSKTRKGRSIAWYQAVTGEFDDREDIERIVRQIKEREHIKEIQIIEKRKVVRA